MANSENAPASAEEKYLVPPDKFAGIKARFDLESTPVPGETSSLDSWIKSKLVAVMEADDFEAINAIGSETGLTASQNLVGRTLEITDFEMRESADQYKKGSQFGKVVYAKAVDTTSGEEFVMDGGGDQFIAAMVRMRDLYGFPFVGTVVGITTGSGNTLLSWRFQNPGRPKIQY